jgi:hypothetical protein
VDSKFEKTLNAKNKKSSISKLCKYFIHKFYPSLSITKKQKTEKPHPPSIIYTLLFPHMWKKEVGVEMTFNHNKYNLAKSTL